MHHRTALACVTALLAAACDREDPCRELVARENQRLAAIPAGDTATLDGILADDYELTFGSGLTKTKSELMEHVRAMPESARRIRETLEDARCRRHGDAAIVSGVVVVSIPSAEGTSTTRARLTDTWIRTGSGWRLVAAHVNEAK
jgi:ketosteroid isomerase-like protein